MRQRDSTEEEAGETWSLRGTQTLALNMEEGGHIRGSLWRLGTAPRRQATRRWGLSSTAARKWILPTAGMIEQILP